MGVADMQRRGLNIRKDLLKLIMPVLRNLSPRVASKMVAGIGRTEYSLLPGLRHRVDTAVERSNLYFGGHWNIPQVGRELAGNQIRWRTRDQLLDGLPNERVAPLFEVTGLDALKAALALGKGMILLCNHFGAHMMPAHWLVREGYPLRLYMERPRHISKFLSSQFDSDGPMGQRKLFISRTANAAEAAGSILRASRILAAGTIVMIACDVRWAGQHTVPARFLGETYTFSATWVTLAALAGAPVLPVFCRVDAEGTYHLEFLPHYHIPSHAQRSEQAVEWVQASLRAIEERVAIYPENSNEYFFWSETSELTSGAPNRADGKGNSAHPLS
jgi:phosphatidylinositol dimannoside acyltransferase